MTIEELDVTNIEEVSKAIASGHVTMAQVASKAAVELIDGCYVPLPTIWHAVDEESESLGEITGEFDNGKEIAQEYINRGDFGCGKQTFWIEVTCWREGVDEDGDIFRVGKEYHSIAVEPPNHIV